MDLHVCLKAVSPLGSPKVHSLHKGSLLVLYVLWGSDKYMMTCIHHYGIIQSIFTAPQNPVRHPFILLSQLTLATTAQPCLLSIRSLKLLPFS